MAMPKKKTTPKSDNKINLPKSGKDVAKRLLGSSTVNGKKVLEGGVGAGKGAAFRAVNREILKRQIGKAAVKGVQATAKINKKDIGSKAAKAVREQNKAAKLMITKSQSAIDAGRKAAATKKANANELARKQGIKNKLKGAAAAGGPMFAAGYGSRQAQTKPTKKK
jgi:hypothetical protein